MPIGKKPVSLSSLPMTGGVRRSFSGDEELTPPPYRTLPAQTALEAFPPPSTSREFSPSLKTGNSGVSTAGTAEGHVWAGWWETRSGVTGADSLNFSFLSIETSFSLVLLDSHFTLRDESSGKEGFSS